MGKKKEKTAATFIGRFFNLMGTRTEKRDVLKVELLIFGNKAKYLTVRSAYFGQNCGTIKHIVIFSSVP